MAVADTGELKLEESPSILGSRFEKLGQIGEGTYGEVYRARDIKTGEILALKKIRTDGKTQELPENAIREIKILKSLRHENIIRLREVVTSSGEEGEDNQQQTDGIYMVFEYMDHDLDGLANHPEVNFSVPQVKCYMKQLLTGLAYCHANQVLHRDIKGANILVDNEGNLKLADFGIARLISDDDNQNRMHLRLPLSSLDDDTRKLVCFENPKTLFGDDINKKFTNEVNTTLWYRPPELLLGAAKYGPEFDMWSVGCIFAELLNGKPIFPGRSEIDQVNKIFQICGSPTEDNWHGVSSLRLYYNFKPDHPMKRRLRETFRHFGRHAFELLDRLLVLDPSQRISAKEALAADYFSTDPFPSDPKSLPSYESSHNLKINQAKA